MIRYDHEAAGCQLGVAHTSKYILFFAIAFVFSLIQYGEHFLDFEDFHELMVQMLSKPHGRYSFFNGLAPDNLFFHGVACQCVKLQLGQLGLDCEFLSCEIQVEDRVWEGIRRKYWHGRDTYYLPMVTWNAAYLEGSNANYTVNSEPRTTKQPADADMDMDGKRHRVA